MEEIELNLPANNWKPRRDQLEVWQALLDTNLKSVTVCAHRRYGKDELCLNAILIRALQRVGTYFYCLPEYNQARKVIFEGINPSTGVARWKSIIPESIIESVNATTMKIELKNGSVIQLVGSDSRDSLMGTSPVGVVFSEYALASPVTSAFFDPILKQNGGFAWYISTPRGKNHHYQQFLVSEASDVGRAFHLPATLTDVFSKKDLAETLKEYRIKHGEVLGTSLFEQEYLCSWESAVIGAVYGKELSELEEDGRAKPIAFDARYPVITSLDIGVNDSTVLYYWQVINKTPRLIDWAEFQGVGLQSVVEDMLSKRYMYSLHIAPHDVNARSWASDGLSRADEARKLGVNFTATPRPDTKAVGIAACAQLIRAMEINVSDTVGDNIYSDCRYVLDTLKQYRFAYDEDKKIMSKNPVHDFSSHFNDALQTFALYWVQEMHKGSKGFRVQGTMANRQFDGIRLSDLRKKLNKKRPRSAWS